MTSAPHKPILKIPNSPRSPATPSGSRRPSMVHYVSSPTARSRPSPRHSSVNQQYGATPTTPTRLGLRRPSIVQAASSMPGPALLSYGSTSATHTRPQTPMSPPGAPTTPTYRRPSVSTPAAVARYPATMPANALPNPFGTPPDDLPPAYYQYNPGSPSYAASPRSRLSQAPLTPHTSTLSRVIPVNIRHHNDAVSRHHVPMGTWQTSTFFISSFEYLQSSYYSVHPAFSDWLHTAGPDNLALIWREVDGNLLLPVVVIYEYRSKANIAGYESGARFEYLHLSHDGRSYTREYMGDICVREQWHLIHKNKPLLMFAQAGNIRLIPIRGEMFKPKGGEL